jgi:ppGpp synthetase/RelA/SpoT-type nucleotidyltranferase
MKHAIFLLRELLEDTETAPLATSEHLPDDPWRYFLKVPGAILIPLKNLHTIRARPSGIENASKHMANAYNGSGAKRKPISVKEEGGGMYTVVDGNSTTFIANKNKWKSLPALVTQDEEFKPGTVRKWEAGTFIKNSAGDWEPYGGPAQYKKTAKKKSPASAAEIDPQLKKISDLQTAGTLPKSYTTQEHRDIATKFIDKHSEGLAACVDRIQDIAVGSDTTVVARAKTVDSALGKLARKPKYGTVANLKDGTGVRIVCASVQDVLENVKKMKDTFETSTTDEEDYINHPKDGYRSYHLVIKDKDDLWKEVQIRTPNQDTWANWCHDVYKPTNPEQEKAVSEAKDEILKYGNTFSDYYYDKESGRPPPKPPDCPPVVRDVFGCLPL